MNNKLYAYNVGTQSVGVDLETWKSTDLNGNEPFIVATGSVSGYSDINSIENWNKFGGLVTKDHIELTRALQLMCLETGFENLTNAEKDIIIEHNAYAKSARHLNADSEKITYLMTQEMTLTEAKAFLIEKWWEHWTEHVKICKERWYCIVKVVVKYLNFEDANDVLNTTLDLIEYYIDSGRIGIEYGDERSGLLDYIDSVNDYASIGLEYNSYVLEQGTWTEFKTELRDVMLDNKFWDEIKGLL